MPLLRQFSVRPERTALVFGDASQVSKFHLLRRDVETNIAPSSDLFGPMTVTPMSTLTKGVASLIADPSLNGQIFEIHGESVTPRVQPEYVDEDSRKNLETFWNLGYA